MNAFPHRSTLRGVLLAAGLLGFSNIACADDPEPCTWMWRTRTMSSLSSSIVVHDEGIGRSTILISNRNLVSSGVIGRDGTVREWTGDTWKKTLSQGIGPGDFFLRYAFAYDSRRGCSYTFGGMSDDSSPVRTNDTWRWDGSTWEKVFPLHRPPARQDAKMAYDPKRDRVVLFGGKATAILTDTWEYDGSDWRQISTPGPAFTWVASMWYDPLRQRVVAAGEGTGMLWEFDGASWSIQSGLPAGVTSPNSAGFDGTENTLTSFKEIWRRQNDAWIKLCGLPDQPFFPGLIPFDINRFTGQIFSTVTGTFNEVDGWQCFSWDATAWTLRAQNPEPVVGAGLAWDGPTQSLVIFGGKRTSSGSQSTFRLNNELWEAWAQASPTRPSDRFLHGMCSDSARNGILVFGGINGGGSVRRGDTWKLANGVWTQVATTGPSARSSLSMSDDSDRGRVVLFGGVEGTSTVLGDTWEWDGSVWTKQLIAGPSPRTRVAMCYDPIRKKHILFGGVNGSTYYFDTWEYDGAAWTQVASGSPDIRGGALAFHPGMGCPILIGTSNNFVGTSVWCWKDGAWSEVMLTGSAPSTGSYLTRACTDPVNQTVAVCQNSLTSNYPTTQDSVFEIVPAEPLTVGIRTANTIIRRGESVLLAAMPSSEGPHNYGWARDSEYLINGSQPQGSELFNVNGRTLAIVNTQPSDAGNYSVLVADPCATVTAQVVITVTCQADFNRDTVVDDMDFQSFLPAYDQLLCANQCPCDLNADGFVDDQDFALFLPHYNNLVCP